MQLYLILPLCFNKNLIIQKDVFILIYQLYLKANVVFIVYRKTFLNKHYQLFEITTFVLFKIYGTAVYQY